MPPLPLEKPIVDDIDRILGYLNFSSGNCDPAVLGQLNHVYAALMACGAECQTPVWQLLHQVLKDRVATAADENAALRDATQAKRVIELTFESVLPRYLEHHCDLLFHQSAASMFNAFFIGRTFEIVLRLVSEETRDHRIPHAAVRLLNDYVGHRPVAVLETGKREPYEHEWTRPIPLYIQNAGVACGPYAAIVESAVSHLRNTDPDILFAAQFDPAMLDELALDPRSFDFDHPINKRPNFHFGQWDEHLIDINGLYRRFVIHGVTLEALRSRVTQVREDDPSMSESELVFESGAVLAGTILMGSGISGRGPGTYDSTVSLGDIVAKVADYRDRFYEDLLSRTPTDHRERLLQEARIRRQPFGAARQWLNEELTARRANQLIQVHLSLVYARMGYADAAMAHVEKLPVASTRMTCQLECLLANGSLALLDGDLTTACQNLPRMFDLMLRAIDCGALIDPWNILGFDGNYQVFQGMENSFFDHRADQLIDLVEQMFGFGSSIWISAKANQQAEIATRVENELKEIAEWWHQFATHTVSSVESFDAMEVFEATRKVAELIGQWSEHGAERGNVEFWARHAGVFDSDREYVLATGSLIDRHDYDTSMALLIHWLGNHISPHEYISIGAFHSMVGSWVTRQIADLDDKTDDATWTEAAVEAWRRMRKFCDYMEANSEELWKVPEFSLADASPRDDLVAADEDNDFGDDEHDELFDAAYEGVVFHDSGNDGFEGEVFEGGDEILGELQDEMDRIVERLRFIEAVMYTRGDALLLVHDIRRRSGVAENATLFDEASRTVHDWYAQTLQTGRQLERLIRSIEQYQLPESDGSETSLAEYDRQRLFKESLLEQVMHLYVQNAATRVNSGAVCQSLGIDLDDDSIDEEIRFWIDSAAALLAHDRRQLQTLLPGFVKLLMRLPLLYVPLSRGGDPMRISRVRIRQSLLGQLLDSLPRLGLFRETRDILHTALMMEKKQSVRQGAVTEFDELFQIGYTSMVEALVQSTRQELEDQTQAGESNATEDSADDANEDQKGSESVLFESLETLAEAMLRLWLGHSQTLRLTVLEKVRRSSDWQKIVDFIKHFGEDVFTQQFLNLPNIRAILHQGVDTWLDSLEREERDDDIGYRFLERINDDYPRKDVVRYLTFVLESIIENFAEFRDYNTTTTVSDDGTLLYCLLDFLRLRCAYDQVAWNLKPVMWTHDSLVRNGYRRVARQWRRLLTERVSGESERLLQNLRELQERYSIQMASVAQRLNERFVHPMHIDRLLAMVGRAARDPKSLESKRAFDMIEHYVEALMQLPVGSGLDIPPWLSALESEVEIAFSTSTPKQPGKRNDSLIGYDLPSLDDLRRQLDDLPDSI